MQNLNFQKDCLDVGQAYHDLEHLFLFICRKIFKENFIEAGIDVLIREITNNNELAFKKVQDADFGIDYYQALNNCNITTEQKTNLEYKMHRYLKELCLQLAIRLPLSLNHFKEIKNLSPATCLGQIRPKFKNLPFLSDFIEDNRLGTVEIQYLKLLDIDWSQCINDIYQFWTSVYNYKDAGGNYVFKEIGLYAINILSLPFSNAVVERVFSLMNSFKTKSRNRLHVETIESILRLKIFLLNNKICCKDFAVTKEMLQRFNSNSMYKNTETDDVIDSLFD